MKLAVTALHANLTPAVTLQCVDQFDDLHTESLAAIDIQRSRMLHNVPSYRRARSAG
jgi:hypothetical protein